MSIYDFSAETLDGKPAPLSDLRDKVVLIVNTASKCGFTPQFCSLTYDVDFPMMRKIDVNGPATHPLYAYLKHAKKGVLGSEGVKWNFTKFLVDRKGEVVKRFAPRDTPQSLEGAIEALL
jgi:glutathione peroxidase